MAKQPSRPYTPVKRTSSKSTQKEDDKDAKIAVAGTIGDKPGDAGANEQTGRSKAEEAVQGATKGAEKTAEQTAPAKKGDQPWINQISLLLVGGILTVLGNAGVAWFNGRNAISVEREKAKSSLILQAIASSDANVSFRNIMFFVESRLIPDPDGRLIQAACRYLPVLPSAGAPPAQVITPSQYEAAFWAVTIDEDAKARIDEAVAKIVANKSRYEIVGKATNNPWYVIGIIHWREAISRFDSSLLDGKKFLEGSNNPTLWEDDAIKAFRKFGISDLNGASLGVVLEGIERFNGTQFRQRGGSTPYLWGRTSGYTRSTYAGDMVRVEEAMARMPGAVAILRALNEQSIIQLDDTGRRSNVANSASAPPLDCSVKATEPKSTAPG